MNTLLIIAIFIGSLICTTLLILDEEAGMFMLFVTIAGWVNLGFVLGKATN